MNTLKWILFLGIMLLSGCTNLSSKVMMKDTFNYNMAFYSTRNKELLLNIVRLRYDHPTAVLAIGNISGSTTITSSGGFTGELQWVGPPFSRTGSISPTGNLSYTENPIISYTPLDDADYNTRFLTPLSLQHLFILLNSSWSVARVLRVSLQRAGDAMNASNAARPTSSHPPRFKSFDEMVYVLRRLQLNDAFVILYEATNNGNTLTFKLNKRAKLTAKDLAIFRKAGVEVYNNQIVFANYSAPHTTLVVTRSVLGIMHYLSKGLEITDQDLKDKKLTITYDEKGNMYDWQKVLRGIMRIRSCDVAPNDALVAIPYLGHWYYIAESDSNSKQTFMMVINILGLLAGNTPPPTIGITRVA